MNRSGMSGRVMRRRKGKARDHVESDRDLDMNNIPPLPSIEGDLILDVLTRQPQRSPSSPPDNTEHGGAERLAELGNTVLSMTIMYILFQRTPFISATDLSVRRRSCHTYISLLPYHRKGIKN